MISYLSYIFKRLISSKSLYIITSTLLALIFISWIFVFNVLDLTIGNLSSIIFAVIFTFGTIFSAIISLNIFKSGEEDGTELLVISKPISRSTIILCKFLLWFLCILFYSFFIFIITWISTQFSKNHYEVTGTNLLASFGVTDKFLFAISVFLGNLIVTIFFSSIIILFSSFFGNISTLLVSILVPTLIPIISLSLEGIAPTNPPSFKDSRYAYFLEPSNDNSVVGNDLLYFYDKTKLIDNNQKQLDDYSNSPYYKFAPFNIWLHFRGFYSLTSHNIIDEKNGKFAPYSSDYFHPIIKLENKEYAYIFKEYFIHITKEYPNIIKFTNSIAKYCLNHAADIVKNLKSEYIFGDPATTPGQTDELIKYLNLAINKYSDSELLDLAQTDPTNPLVIYWELYGKYESLNGYGGEINQIMPPIVLYLQNHISNLKKVTKLKVNSDKTSELWEDEISSFIQKDTDLEIWRYEDLAPKNIIVPIYITLAFLMFGLVILRFYFRDLK